VTQPYITSVAAVLPARGPDEIIESRPASPSPRRRPAWSALAAVAVVVLASGGLTYALVTTRQDLDRTRSTLGATRTNLATTQGLLSATQATLSSTEKKLTDAQTELAAARDQISTIKSQLADARGDAEQERARGDEAVQAARDLRVCLNNVLVNTNAVQNGDYGSMTWNDDMYTQCQHAIDEGDTMAEAPPVTTTT
jgi:septal ring factor EnvC (AmiA/AmiB activator)